VSKLLERLSDPSKSGVYRASRAGTIEEVARDGGLDLASIALREVSSKEDLLKAIADGLGFPEWFGGNWDALEDCLGDLSWRRAGGRVFLFHQWEEIGEDERGVLVDVLRSSAEFWAEAGKPFFAVFIDPAHSLSLPALYREA
jgi:hypothetical protein